MRVLRVLSWRCQSPGGTISVRGSSNSVACTERVNPRDAAPGLEARHVATWVLNFNDAFQPPTRHACPDIESDTIVMHERPQLKQVIGRLGFFSLAFGAMIGVGWITGLKQMFENAGPVGTAIAFVAGGGLMIVIGLCYAETMQRLPVTGGEVAYAYQAFGTRQAFVIGWCLAFGYLSVSGSPARLPWPVEWIVLSVVLLTGLAFWIGARRVRHQLPKTERRRLILDADTVTSAAVASQPPD